MKLKRLCALTLAVFMLTLCLPTLSACSNAQKNVQVTIVDEVSDTALIDLSGKVKVPENANAGECIRQLLNQNDTPAVGIDDGYITEVGTLQNGDTYAWMFYVNGELSDVGISDCIPTSDDEIRLVYVDWTALFAE